jgi:hypothetical protein
MNIILSEHILGKIVVRYIQPEGTNYCELHLVPLNKRAAISEPRQYIEDRPEILGLPPKFKPLKADRPGSLVQLKLQQDDTGSGFASGMTLTDSQTMDALEF